MVSNGFYVHPENWGNDPIWLIFLRWVETTNEVITPCPVFNQSTPILREQKQWFSIQKESFVFISLTRWFNLWPKWDPQRLGRSQVQPTVTNLWVRVTDHNSHHPFKERALFSHSAWLAKRLKLSGITCLVGKIIQNIRGITTPLLDRILSPWEKSQPCRDSNGRPWHDLVD